MKNIIIVSFLFLAACAAQHDGVKDSYSAGFYNATAIFQHRYDSVLHLDPKFTQKFPDWQDNKRSFKGNLDLYNYWDTSFNATKKQP